MEFLRRAILLLAASSLVLAGDAEAQRSITSGPIREGTLSFDGHATTGDFTGTTSTVTGEMTGGAELAAVRGWVEAPVQTLITGNNKRDRDLNKSMESEKYPTVRYELVAVLPGETRGDTTTVTLHGYFLIHGVREHAAIPATVLFLSDGIRVRGDTPLNLKTYNIGGLTKMLGMLKMHEEILVHLDLTFGAPPTG
ncbi:MAG: YceI family protein [Gemmatimonadales bacterium]